MLLGDKVFSKLSVPNQRDQPESYSINLRLRKGPVAIGIKFLNDFYRPAANGQPQLDRNLVIHHVELSSSRISKERLDPTKLTQLHRNLLKNLAKSNDENAVLKEMLKMLSSRAYRRPVADAELDTLMDLTLRVRSEGASLEETLQVDRAGDTHIFCWRAAQGSERHQPVGWRIHLS